MSFRTINRQIIKDGVMSSTNTIYGDILQIDQGMTVAFECVFTGTPTGTLTVEGSNTGSNWNTLDIDINSPVGSAGTTGIDILRTGFRYLRLKYTNISGSGVLQAYIYAKGGI